MAEIFGPGMSVSFNAIENTIFPFHTEVFLKFYLTSRLQECFLLKLYFLLPGYIETGFKCVRSWAEELPNTH
jgi:hypothetical protein